MQDEYLTRCVVDPVKRKFYLFSDTGDERVVDCDNIDDFMSVLTFVRSTLDEQTLAYANLSRKMTFNSKRRKKIPKIFTL